MNKYSEPAGIPEERRWRTFVATYIGLPDMQYRDITAQAETSNEALILIEAELVRIYGYGIEFDLLEIKEPEFHHN